MDNRLLRAMAAGVTAALFHGGRNSGWYTSLRGGRGRWGTASRHWDEVEPANVPIRPAEALVGAIVVGGLFGAGGYVIQRLLPLPPTVTGVIYGVGCFAAVEAVNQALPAERRVKRRVFREPGTAIVSLTTAGAAVAWFSR